MNLVEEMLAKIGALPPDARAEFEAGISAATSGMLWTPNVGPQTVGYLSLADELYFGGEAGGGKTHLGIGLALNEHRLCLILRRFRDDARKISEMMTEIVGNSDGLNSQLLSWKMPGPNGGRNGPRIIDFGGVKDEGDKQRYKGQRRDLIVFDELPDFLESQYTFITGWSGTADEGQRVRIVGCGNPPTTPEGLWVTKRWGAWLDPTHPRPAKPGELRWYTTGEDGKDMEVDGPGPHMIAGKPVMARSRTFIRSRVSDNPYLMNTGYVKTLDALPEPYRSAYRDGRFDLSFKDDDRQVIPTAWVVAAQSRWKPDGHRGLAMTAMAVDPAGGGEDPMVMGSRYGGWYSPFVELRGEQTSDGSLMTGHVVSHRKDGCPIVIDVGGGYAGPLLERFKDNQIDATKFNGAQATTAKAKGTGLSFANCRAEAAWRLKEELDPDQEGGSAIALPPDDELRADLCSLRWELTTRGILVGPKDDIKEKIGRSPGKGDVAMMCLAFGNKAAMRRVTQMMPTGNQSVAVTRKPRGYR